MVGIHRERGFDLLGFSTPVNIAFVWQINNAGHVMSCMHGLNIERRVCFVERAV